jgi:hypothetical protein
MTLSPLGPAAETGAMAKARTTRRAASKSTFVFFMMTSNVVVITMFQDTVLRIT